MRPQFIITTRPHGPPVALNEYGFILLTFPWRYNNAPKNRFGVALSITNFLMY